MSGLRPVWRLCLDDGLHGPRIHDDPWNRFVLQWTPESAYCAESNVVEYDVRVYRLYTGTHPMLWLYVGYMWPLLSAEDWMSLTWVRACA